MKIFENKNILCLVMACALILMTASCISASNTDHLNTTEIQQIEETNVNLENTDYQINQTATIAESSHSQINRECEVQALAENTHSQISRERKCRIRLKTSPKP